ncbi:hypothetical protein [Psychroserpens mesophilus]|uniref:hypothetical protein n=1 Tax=Psychroserpens mesophilus TaxID=325473 RepID=UPI003D646750
MKTTKQILGLLVLFLIISCGTDGTDDSETFSDTGVVVPPTLSTLSATNITGTTVTLGGNIISEGSSSVNNRGVCWSLNANPTTSNYTRYSDGSGLGTYTVDIDDLEPNTTYHVRAFANNNSNNTVYGNDITFTTGDVVDFDFDIPKNINTTRVDLTAIIESTSYVSNRGFVFDTSPNPTIDNITVQLGYGVGEYGGQINNLNPNTTYYVRPYANTNFGYIYGNQQTFKTTGYFGPAGGYVVFDKGEYSEGWRYLEASPEQSIFSNEWGCDNTFISNTYEDVGAGFANTNQIMSNCNEASFATRTAYFYSYNGYSDWFLPSRLEAVIVLRSLSDLNALYLSSHWTSTEVSSGTAYRVIYDSSSGDITSYVSEKYYSYGYVPIRSY